MPRISLKIVGASGQGINSIGAIIAKGLKRSGYCVFGYREYPSLIKGGHASYQLDVSNERICSTETKVNVLVALNHHGLELNMDELKQGGIVLHVTPGWPFTEHHQKLIAERSLRVIYFPVDDILNRLGAREIASIVRMQGVLPQSQMQVRSGGKRSSSMRNASTLSGFIRKSTESASDFASAVRNLILDVRDSYGPELHCMRGPGPKWHAKHRPWLRFAFEAVPPSGRHELSPVHARPRDSANLAR